jgi:hypothetical protein
MLTPTAGDARSAQLCRWMQLLIEIASWRYKKG